MQQFGKCPAPSERFEVTVRYRPPQDPEHIGHLGDQLEDVIVCLFCLHYPFHYWHIHDDDDDDDGEWWNHFTELELLETALELNRGSI